MPVGRQSPLLALLPSAAGHRWCRRCRGGQCAVARSVSGGRGGAGDDAGDPDLDPGAAGRSLAWRCVTALGLDVDFWRAGGARRTVVAGDPDSAAGDAQRRASTTAALAYGLEQLRIGAAPP